MTQTAELARVKGRIKALTEKTVSNGCTEAEALAAAEMVGRLLERYALSMDEIDIRELRCVQIEIGVGGQRRRPIDACIPAIARFCECKVWLARDEAQAKYVFFGFETDTALAGYLFSVVDRAIATEVDTFRRTHPQFKGVALRRASASFEHGMAARVAERLDAMHDARDEAVAAQRSSGTALMLVKHRVVDDAFRETWIFASSTRAGEMFAEIPSAFRAGFAAGDRVNLQRPVSGGRQEQIG